MRGGVVAELADLGGRLVDEAEVALGGAHRLRPEEVVAGAGGERARRPRGRSRSRPWSRTRTVSPARVAAAHLEPVEGGERLLDRRADLDGRPRRRRARRARATAAAVRQPVAHHRPQRVLQPERARRWRPRGVRPAGAPVGVELRLGGADPVVRPRRRRRPARVADARGRARAGRRRRCVRSRRVERPRAAPAAASAAATGSAAVERRAGRRSSGSRTLSGVERRPRRRALAGGR